MKHGTYCAPRSSLLSLTPSAEEYLEAIYTLGRLEKGPAKVKELAKALRVKDPSVVQMLRKLKKGGLVKYNRLGARLTSKGRKYVVKIVRRHELAERLLTDVFEYPLPKVHEIACKFEHVMDDELTRRIEKMLNDPKTCPHGSPIPAQNGEVNKNETEQLAKTPKGGKRVVVKIPEERAAVERLLALNVIPGVEVKVLEKLPRGAIVLLCGNTRVALSHNIASQIEVRGEHRGGDSFG
jgi:DtxR family Mn-dependent transcriptional regulator